MSGGTTGEMGKQLPDWARRGQAKWSYRGQERPSFAQTPHPGQESIWDYPRPPRVERDRRRVVVRAHERTVADSRATYRILETASPPTFYIPPKDIDFSLLRATATSSACEWKGIAQYWSLDFDDLHLEAVAWAYPEPFPGFELMAGYLAFYPNRLECYADGERVQPQPGTLYGGWVTQELVGPFKGEPGTEHW